MYEEIKGVLIWIVSGLVALTAWVFRYSQAEQDRRLDALEKKNPLQDAATINLERSMMEAIERMNREDEARHERDRKETKQDLQRIMDKNEAQHNAIMKKLDSLFSRKNG